MRRLLSRDEIERRLRLIFPREAFDTTLSNPLAAAAVASMLYVDAIQPDDAPDAEGQGWARPTTVMWMADEVYCRDLPDQRLEWRDAALGGNARRKVEELHESWGVPKDVRWYADNTRETLRDETWPGWRRHGAALLRTGIKTTSDKPRWALSSSFADLFDPHLADEDALETAISEWVDAHLTPGDRLRRVTLHGRAQEGYEVEVTLPNGTMRRLEPGDASLILKGVIESWATARLLDPVVVSVSEPGSKVYVLDSAFLSSLGVTIDPTTLLPDAVIADIGSTPIMFWIVEVAASDGVVSDERREKLLAWATNQRIPPEQCAFLTAFADRNSPAAKRRLKDLALDTFAWFLTEPSSELSWSEIQSPGGTVSALPLKDLKPVPGS